MLLIRSPNSFCGFRFYFPTPFFNKINSQLIRTLIVGKKKRKYLRKSINESTLTICRKKGGKKDFCFFFFLN